MIIISPPKISRKPLIFGYPFIPRPHAKGTLFTKKKVFLVYERPLVFKTKVFFNAKGLWYIKSISRIIFTPFLNFTEPGKMI